MTSRKKKNKVVILCEDITHERFIYQYLAEVETLVTEKGVWSENTTFFVMGKK